MPATELLQFQQHLRYATDMVATAASISALATPVLDVSDLYRAALMQGVSAFDYFIHEEVRSRMLQLHSSHSSAWPPAFRAFRIPVGTVTTVGTDHHLNAVELDAEIRRQHGYLSFQNPDKVADACRLVSTVDIWAAVAAARGLTSQGRLNPSQVAKKDWSLIVDRRNLIVHEADMEPTQPRTHRFRISRPDVEGALAQVQIVAAAISASL